MIKIKQREINTFLLKVLRVSKFKFPKCYGVLVFFSNQEKITVYK